MRLVKDAGKATRWFSIQFAALGVAVEVAWRAMPPDLTGNIPGWAQSAITVLIFTGVVLGRLVDQGGEDGPN